MQQASSSSSSSAQRQEKLSTSDIEAPATHQHQPKPALDKNTLQRRIRIGTTGSWVINILLLLAKIAAFAVSRSYSILASVVDSVVDIISQILLAVAAAKAKKWNPKYPTGRSRLESVSVIGCAMVMAMCSVLVIREAVGAIIETTRTGSLPNLDMNAITYTILGFSIASKAVLWIYCALLRKYSAMMLALAEDHWNDVLSNAVAVCTASIAFYVPKVWWIDPAAGTAVSLYILWSWWNIGKEQVGHIVGKAAPQEFIDEVVEIANTHGKDMQVDRVQAYHFGQRYVVEMEVVMQEDTVLRVSHDTALYLQHKIEALDTVERAYVHVDYRTREQLEHKIERNLNCGVEDIAAGYRETASGRMQPPTTPQPSNEDSK